MIPGAPGPQLEARSKVNTRTRSTTTRPGILAAAISVAAIALATGCLNTQSTAFEEQPAPLTSPADACRAAAAAEGFTVIEVTDLREVSEGYWEANFVIQDPELRNLLGCRHSIPGGFTEVVRLDE